MNSIIFIVISLCWPWDERISQIYGPLFITYDYWYPVVNYITLTVFTAVASFIAFFALPSKFINQYDQHRKSLKIGKYRLESRIKPTIYTLRIVVVIIQIAFSITLLFISIGIQNRMILLVALIVLNICFLCTSYRAFRKGLDRTLAEWRDFFINKKCELYNEVYDGIINKTYAAAMQNCPAVMENNDDIIPLAFDELHACIMACTKCGKIVCNNQDKIYKRVENFIVMLTNDSEYRHVPKRTVITLDVLALNCRELLRDKFIDSSRLRRYLVSYSAIYKHIYLRNQYEELYMIEKGQNRKQINELKMIINNRNKDRSGCWPYIHIVRKNILECIAAYNEEPFLNINGGIIPTSNALHNWNELLSYWLFYKCDTTFHDAFGYLPTGSINTFAQKTFNAIISIKKDDLRIMRDEMIQAGHTMENITTILNNSGKMLDISLHRRLYRTRDINIKDVDINEV